MADLKVSNRLVLSYFKCTHVCVGQTGLSVGIGKSVQKLRPLPNCFASHRATETGVFSFSLDKLKKD